MEKIVITENLQGSKIAAGCMRIKDMDFQAADNFVRSCLDEGVDYFDHADIYGGNGKCEEVFGAVLKADKSLRGRMKLQTKCGIRKMPFGTMFDFSYEHIIKSAEGSLKRLQTEQLDVLLLHRPDTLMQPEEIAKAFRELNKSGKVKYFGVSNQNPGQIELINRALDKPVKINQLQLSALFTGMIDAGFNVNMKTDAAVNRDGGVLEYCRLNGITLQAWCPYTHPWNEVFIGSDKYPALNNVLERAARKYGVSSTGIAAAFILRHPAKWQVVTGTTKPSRMKEICAAADIKLTREEWYEIYLSAGNKLP